MSVGTKSDRVSNAKLREEFLRRRDAGLLTAELVALRMGWETSGRRSDGNRVLKNLGIRLERAGGRSYRWQSVRYERAVALAVAMDMDPVDCDL